MQRTLQLGMAICHGHALTRHAARRMQQRALSADMLREVLAFGREVHSRGATIYAVGRKEVAIARRDGIDLAGAEHVHVVCTAEGTVLTAYRNRDFRDLRSEPRRSRRRSW